MARALELEGMSLDDVNRAVANLKSASSYRSQNTTQNREFTLGPKRVRS